MRALLLATTAIMLASVAWAGGRSASETCSSTGLRPGTPAFTVCVSQVGGDDPLSALETATASGTPRDGSDDAAAAITPEGGKALKDVPRMPKLGLEPNGLFGASTGLVIGSQAPPLAAPPPAPPSSLPPPPVAGGGFVQPPRAPEMPAGFVSGFSGWPFGN
ncbi:MAG: hypothetical protein HY985_13360 [Magnetospirillum sp.]|nr:hypothetical protein [Magnetospirillum sp.]